MKYTLTIKMNTNTIIHHSNNDLVKMRELFMSLKNYRIGESAMLIDNTTGEILGDYKNSYSANNYNYTEYISETLMERR